MDDNEDEPDVDAIGRRVPIVGYRSSKRASIETHSKPAFGEAGVPNTS